MACISTTFKYIVLLFNLLFFFLGCAIIGVGIYMQVKMAAYFDLLGDITINSATIFIIVGVIITIISFFGCCGAIMENECMMYTFASLITLLLLIEVGLTVVILIYQDDAKSEVSKRMKEGLDNYNTTESHGVTLTWDEMQKKYECCGVNEPEDWDKKFPNSVPDSCCEVVTQGCGVNKLSIPDGPYWRTGCLEKFDAQIKSNVEVAGAVGGVLGGIQLIAILVACCMARKMRNRRYEDYDHSPSAPLYATY